MSDPAIQKLQGKKTYTKIKSCKHIPKGECTQCTSTELFDSLFFCSFKLRSGLVIITRRCIYNTWTQNIRWSYQFIFNPKIIMTEHALTMSRFQVKCFNIKIHTKWKEISDLVHAKKVHGEKKKKNVNWEMKLREFFMRVTDTDRTWIQSAET